ncbi:MAG TPA: D-glycerate dehydrogenase [Gemmatimonadota bacterium]|nr:D-glycerate dehydrogenase [Gemmatimonadota bacterium]
MEARAPSERPLVLIDAALPDGPLAALDGVAEVVRFADADDLERSIADHGPRIRGLGVQLTTEVDEPLLTRLPALEIVADYAVGYDNVDLAAAARHGVAVTHTPDVLTDATADLTWALILAVARRLVEADRLARSGEWAGWHPRQLLGKELTGGTLAILGMGRIGEAVARRGRAFGMGIVYWSRSERPEIERELGARRLDLSEALAVADVASIHLPLTSDTRQLLDAGRLAGMRSDAILVNTARGPIVDEEALADALEAGRLLGAGLDVHEREPLVHPRLAASPRTVLLPHVGSATVATRERMAAVVARNLRAVLSGEPPTDPVPITG